MEEHWRTQVCIQQLADSHAAQTLPTADRHIRVCPDLRSSTNVTYAYCMKRLSSTLWLCNRGLISVVCAKYAILVAE